MAFDRVIASPGRLSILTALAGESDGQEFVHLRAATRLTDGNLSAHAARLREAGLIEVRKAFRDTKPVTTLRLTPAGRAALEQHARRLLAAVTRPVITPEPAMHLEEEWVD
jgi:DNA-binding MarR family transcriptional regulator